MTNEADGEPGAPGREADDGPRGDGGGRAGDHADAAGADDTLAVLPLRDIVVFPHMIVPLFVGREKSVRALEAVTKEDKQILLVAQKNAVAG